MKYLITLKRNAIGFTSIEDLKKQYKLLFGRFTTQYACIELDSLRRLHVHAIISVKRTPYFKRFLVNGWHVYFNKIEKESESTVIRYVKKHQNKYYQMEMEILSYAHYHYLFVD